MTAAMERALSLATATADGRRIIAPSHEVGVATARALVRAGHATWLIEPRRERGQRNHRTYWLVEVTP